MNTSVQRSSATPFGANTTTAPAGKVKQGKEQFRKDLTECMVAHNIPYVAQAAVGNWMDLTRKIEKAMSIKGPKYIGILQPCQLGWGYPMENTVEMGKLAIETCIWPLYEVENGVYKITYKPKERVVGCRLSVVREEKRQKKELSVVGCPLSVKRRGGRCRAKRHSFHFLQTTDHGPPPLRQAKMN